MAVIDELKELQKEIMALVDRLQNKNDEPIKVLESKLYGIPEDASVKDQLDALERHNNPFFGSGQPQRSPGDDYHVSAQMLEGIAKFAMTGEISNEMSVGSDADGGYLAPPEFDLAIRELVKEISDLRPIATVQATDREAYEFPFDLKGITSGWRGEQGTVTETDTPEVAVFRIPLHENYAEPHVTNRILDMAAVDIGQFLMKGVVQEFAQKEGNAFILGNGVLKPRGFLDHTFASTDDGVRAGDELQYVPSGASGAFAGSDPADPLITLVHKVKPRYRRNARWLMNSATVAAVRKFKDGQGNYLWQTAVIAGQPNMLLGYPVSEAADMPDIAADSLSIAFGDFKHGYTIVDNKDGLRLLRDNLTTKGKTKFYSYRYVGGDVSNFEALKCLKFSAS